MFTLILSAILGVLATKIFDGSKQRKKQTYMYVFMIIFFVLLAVIAELIGNLEKTPGFYNEISGWFNNFEKNIILQCVLIVIFTIIIFCVDTRDVGVLTFDRYSAKIREFTKSARPNSIIRIAAGDMDFLGGVSLDEADIKPLMDDSLEYNQLFELKKILMD
jgi:hypothetical protein